MSHFGRSRLIAATLNVALLASALQAAPARRTPPGGLVLPPLQRLAAEASRTTTGTAVQCVDIRTGSLFEYRAQHLLSSGAIDESWVPDTSNCCLGSPEGIREHVIPDGQGGSYAAWVHSQRDEPDIFLQRFNDCGEVVSGWPPGGRAVCTAPESQYNLDACSDGQGGVLLAWQDFRDGHSSTVYLQRITGDGNPAAGWPEGGMVPAPGGREQAAPHVATDGAGGGVVFWQERDGTGLALRVQRITGDGSVASGWPQGGVTLVPGSQRVGGMNVQEDATGRLTVVWSSSPDLSTLQLAGLDVGAAPAGDWTATATTLSSGAVLISDATMAPDADGGLLVGWSETAGGQTALKLVRLAPGGALAAGWPATGATVVDSSASLSAPAMLPDGSGGATLAWEDQRSLQGGIYAQHVLGDGAVDSLWATNGVPVATGSPSKFAPMLGPDGSGGAIVTWSDAASQEVDQPPPDTPPDTTQLPGPIRIQPIP